MFNAKVNSSLLQLGPGDSPNASAREKARASTRQWAKPLAEEPQACGGQAIWFGNEGEDIDPRFERDETL